MKIPVIATTISQPDAHARLKYSDCRPLPASYMSEYSVLGLVVDEFDRAIEVLGGAGLHIEREAFGAEVEVPGPDKLSEMVGILAEAGVCCSIGDVIDSVYQG